MTKGLIAELPDPDQHRKCVLYTQYTGLGRYFPWKLSFADAHLRQEAAYVP